MGYHQLTGNAKEADPTSLPVISTSFSAKKIRIPY
jgi:hypothetical protein